MNITLTGEQYTALVALARKGAENPQQKSLLESFLKDLERTNNIVRYFLKVRWQEASSPMPPTTRFPDVWPPELEQDLERIDRPIAKADVNDLIKSVANRPVNVMVTPDPAGLVGWTKLDVFFA